MATYYVTSAAGGGGVGSKGDWATIFKHGTWTEEG